MVRTISADDRECVEVAAAVLRDGGLVVFPTDTVYGLGALAGDDAAVLRLFRAKDRAPDRALPLLLADRADLEAVAATVPAAAETLMERFWPGGLTIVLARSPRFHSLALVGGDTVAVRIPDHPLVREMICRAGGPIVGTSANRSGRGGPLTMPEAIEQVEVDLAIDGGRCLGGVESTVIDITYKPVILREGMIDKGEVEAVLGVHLEVDRG
jgi:L-threonylcarbamoyladenylate synthase